MEQYYPRIEQVVKKSGGRANTAVFSVRGACSLPYEYSWSFGRAGCERHIEKALAYADRRDVHTIVLASFWPAYFMKESGETDVLNEKALPALARLRSTIADWRSNGKRVYIVLVAPIGLEFDPRSNIQRVIRSPGFRVKNIQVPPRAELERRSAPIQSLLKDIARDTGSIIIDPVKELCGPTACPAFADGQAMYHDGGHLRPSFVRNRVRFIDETVLETHSVHASVK
jgi:hypothetical protein